MNKEEYNWKDVKVTILGAEVGTKPLTVSETTLNAVREAFPKVELVSIPDMSRLSFVKDMNDSAKGNLVYTLNNGQTLTSDPIEEDLVDEEFIRMFLESISTKIKE